MLEKKISKKTFFFVTKFLVENFYSSIFLCWAPGSPAVMFRPDSKMSPNLYAQHFFIAAFPHFKLMESLRNRNKTILLDQEISFKKIRSENFIFFWSKNIFKKKVEKKSRKKIDPSKFRKNQTIENLKNSNFRSFDFFENLKDRFFLKIFPQLFF